MKKHKKTDAARPAIALLCLLLIICGLFLGYFVLLRPVAISGKVFDDRNSDGDRQQSEVGLANRVIRLLNAAGQEVSKTTSKGDGGYRFDGLEVRKYRVEVLSSSEVVASKPLTVTSRGEMTSIDVGVPPKEPKQLTALRREHEFWAEINGGNKETERAVALALEWLAKHQRSDGGWSFNLKRCKNCRCQNSDTRIDRTAATAMALLPFLGRGITHKNSHQRDAHYRMTVARGVAFLQDRVLADGKVDEESQDRIMYSQGLAGIVLAEMSAMVAEDRRNAKEKELDQADHPNVEFIDEELLLKDAKASLDFICRAQDPEGGGWRYEPSKPGAIQPGDTSIVGWQMMALHAGRKEVLNNPDTWKKAAQFLKFVQADGGATYGYTDNSEPEPRRSAIGLLCRMYDWQKKMPRSATA